MADRTLSNEPDAAKMARHFTVEWIDHGREPQVAPNPNFPDGRDLDASFDKPAACHLALPYPAKRCGFYAIKCNACGITVAVTTAGRPDDPRSIKIACIPIPEGQKQ